ncbi:cupin domain-containing protein [Melioribacteraceae bacterium 4301-Me]|uniref:cupin domain-containing protein n=1 Tax=Pyranulibacter aquaticus TaxID=3163344 RepID=UPI003595EB8D
MKKNFFEDTFVNSNKEFIETVLDSGTFKIERIVSNSYSSPKDFWYDQSLNEFVLLLKGSAKILFDNGEITELSPGDYLLIPAHKKHRIEETDKNQKTFWLTVHYT